MYRTTAPSTDHAVDRDIPEPDAATIGEEDKYFKQNKEPEYLDEVGQQVREFIQYQLEKKRRIAVVTSGGTTVPLENNTVRFIDNFSAGTRGATSTEYFVEQGYAVIFLHRQFSVMPYSRHYTHSNNILDYLEEIDGGIQVGKKYRDQMLPVLRKYKYTKQENLICYIPFTTVNQYLFTLRLVSSKLHEIVPDNSSTLFYLAAAVSDFFLPQSRVSDHKIQSGGGRSGKLIVDLDPVPKFLRRLVDEWNPGAMIVSFKLETDPDILLQKSAAALEKYSHQLVIGNLLQTRKNQVVFVTPAKVEHLNMNEQKSDEGKEIESLIIPKVIEMHDNWIRHRRSIKEKK